MDKRKFLFVSLSGLIGDIAWQVLKEGHDVRYYIEAEKERDIADGFVPKSKDWEKDAKWSDIVVFDDTLGQGEKAQVLRAADDRFAGGTPYTRGLEFLLAEGAIVFQAVGVGSAADDRFAGGAEHLGFFALAESVVENHDVRPFGVFFPVFGFRDEAVGNVALFFRFDVVADVVALFQDLPGDVTDETGKRNEEKFAFVHVWRGPLLAAGMLMIAL